MFRKTVASSFHKYIYFCFIIFFLTVIYKESDAQIGIAGKNDYYYTFQDEVTTSQIDAGIVFDCSEGASLISKAVLKQIIRKFTPESNIFISSYNHEYRNIVQLSTPEKALWELNKTTIPTPSGLCSFYKAIYKSANYLTESGNSNKTLIFFIHSDDNSSLIYSFKDILNLTGKFNISVNIIAYGDNYNEYMMKNISHLTGGKFFILKNYSIDEISIIFDEIIKNEKNINITKISNFEYEKSLKNYSRHQILTLFDKNETSIQKEFYSNLEALSKVMKDNPSTSVVLSGFSNTDELNEKQSELSYSRALAVKKWLINSGIENSRIKIRGLGATKPVYYNPQFTWQNNINRRVEIRWLSPELLPYEIIAQTEKSEINIKNQVFKWNNLGYNAYYDRIILNNEPYYRIKLWGYSTEQDAISEITKLRKKFNTKFSIE